MGVSLVILIDCMVFCHHFLRGVQLFQNWWKLGGGGRYLKIFARKGGGKTKWRRFCQEMRKWVDCHIILRFLRRFFMMQHRKEILLCLSFLCLRGCAQNNCLNKIWNDWHCNSFNSVDGYNSCVHANNKHSAWYFLLLVW